MIETSRDVDDARPEAFDPVGPLPKGTTLLEASAGTGKTYSITSLVLRLVIEAGVEIDKILAVTFTNLATAELTRRIRERLGEAFAALTAAMKAPPTTTDKIILHLIAGARDAHALHERAELARNAVEGFDRAPISTIHGFCQRILQQHALEAGVAFDVELLENASQLVDEIVDDFWVKRVHDANELDLDALDALGVSPRDLRELARVAISHWSADVLPPPPDDASPPDAALTSRVLRAVERAVPLASAHAAAALEAIVRAEPDFEGRWFPNEWRLRDVRRAVDNLTKLRLSPSAIRDLETLDRRWLDNNFRSWPGVDRELADAVFELREAYRVWLPAARPWALGLRHDLVAYARSEAVRRAGVRRVWTFDDLLRKLADALDDAATRRRLETAVGRHYAAVFIDEFQDTDPIQWKIFEALFRTPDTWLFLIGDPKQAIYRFRRADIRTYLAAKRHATQRWSLDVNHRSDAVVVDAVNALFAGATPGHAELAFAVPGIGFSPSRARAEGRRLSGGDVTPLRVLAIERTPANTGKPPADLRRGEIARDWVQRELPRIVAADIRRTLESGQTVPDPDRPDAADARQAIGPQHLAILVRTNDQAIAMREALREQGIPGILHGPQSVFETDEAGELVRVLRAVLEPARTRVVRAALVTDLMGYTAEELARLDAEDPRKLEVPAELLRGWQGVWQRTSFIQMFRQIASSATKRLLGLERGERRLANLLHLGELLHQAAADRALKPAGLLQWLERQRQQPDERDERQQLRLETDDDAVQILTVHKAKGLEFQLVWAPYVWEQASLRWDEKRDLVFRDPDADWKVKLDIGLDDEDRGRKLHLRLGEHEVQTEQLRLLYVALTRAKLQCTIAWGAFVGVPKSPLAYLLPYLPRRAGTVEALEGLKKDLKRRMTGLTDHDLFAPLAPLEARGVRVVVPTTAPRDAPWSPTRAPLTITTREWTRAAPLDTAWRRTSFSGLVAELVDEEQTQQKASDEDRARDEEELIAAAPTGGTPVRLAGLVSGRMVGNALHKILELAEFDTASRETLLPLVTDELAHHGLAPAGGDTALAEAVALALVDVLDTPLAPAGFTLRQVPRAARLPELAFVFPVAGGHGAGLAAGDAAGFTVEALRAAFDAHAGPRHRPWLATLGRLRFEAVRGFLSGSIDLAFRGPDRRFYLIDWKSNRLGPHHVAEEYAADGLWRGMDAHHYHLQYHLYTVAFDRFLRARLGADYTYERDFGGVFYCFLRGMSPAFPPGNGVFFDRPAAALVAALDAAFAAGARA